METVVVEVIKVDQFDTGTVTEFFEEGAAQIIVVEKQREVFNRRPMSSGASPGFILPIAAVKRSGRYWFLCPSVVL